VKETKEQALVWMTKTFAEFFAGLPVKHNLKDYCDSYGCSRCRAEIRLKRLQAACAKK